MDTAKDMRASMLRAFPASDDESRTGEKLCDLCGGGDFQLISRNDRRGDDLDTCVCVRCGLVAHARIPSDAELAEFYAHQYRQAYHGETTPSPRRVVRAWRNGERIYWQLAHYVKPDDHVFEVGAGIGCTVKVFQEQGCHATGIEPGAGFQQFSHDVLKADIARRDLSEMPSGPQHDLVLLVHVIEHLSSPTQALTHIRSLLKPGGRLYVECPNLAAPFALRSRMFHFAHIHNFTPKTLAMLAEKCGFEVEARFGGDDDPNLQMLLRRGAARLEIDAASFSETLESLSRYNVLSYHARWSYVWPRCKKLFTYADEHLLGRLHLRTILARCDSLPALPEPAVHRRAA